MNAALPLVLFLLVSAGGASLRAAGGLHLIGVEEQARAEPSAALVAGQPATLEVMPTPAGFDAAEATPRFNQMAGAIIAPVRVEAEVLPQVYDSRIVRVRVTPPDVRRVTWIDMWLGDLGPVALVVFPADERREDLAPLREALKASGLSLAVCGGSAELRAWLRSQGLDFEDFGERAPDRLDASTLLIGLLRPEDWERLAGPREVGHLLALVGDPSLLPGVYTQPDQSGRRLAKVTLPLAPLLETDPRARETFHQLMLQAMPAASR